MLGKPWRGLDETLKDRIVTAIIDDDEERLRHLLGKAGLGEEWAQTLLDDLDLEEGYTSYSLHAIKKLLPHLEAGLPLTSRDPDVPCALRAAGYEMPWENAVERQPFLPQPPDVTNPIVRQALHELRKLVNAVLRERVYGENHTLSAIHIELAREARGTAAQRQKRTRDMRQRERLRDAAADRIREGGERGVGIGGSGVFDQ